MSLMVRKTASAISDGADYNAEFREIIDGEFSGLEGRQTPQHYVYVEGGDFTHGEKAVELARRFGVTLMPWQREQVMRALAVDEDGRWLHSDIVLLCPRQNGKSLILEVIILYRLFVLNHQIVFSAHQWRTAKSIRNRIWRRIKSKSWAARRLVRNTASAGEAEMETAEGGKLQFTTRSNDMGRGFDQIDLLLLDEAYNLDSGEMDAVGPIQLAAEDPQTFYTSSAVNREKHAKGEQLSRARESALSLGSEGILFAEFCAPEGMDASDPLAWKLANPSYGFPQLANEKKVRSLQSKLSEDGFEVEMLGWGRWFTSVGDSEETLISLAAWSELRVDDPVGTGDACIGLDVSPDGDGVALVAAQRAGEKILLLPSPMTEFVRSEVVEAVARGVEANDPLAVVMDGAGPASTLVDPLVKAGVEPELLGGAAVSKAYELFLRSIHEGVVVHTGDRRFASAWEVARERRGAQGKFRSFERYSGDIAILVAASFAVWGLQEFEIPEVAPEVAQRKKFVGTPKPVVKANVDRQLVF